MYRINPLSLLAIALSLVVPIINAIVLQDLPHLPLDRRSSHSARLFGRQDNHQALDLQNTESFFWRGRYSESNSILSTNMFRSKWHHHCSWKPNSIHAWIQREHHFHATIQRHDKISYMQQYQCRHHLQQQPDLSVRYECLGLGQWSRQPYLHHGCWHW